MLTRRAFFVALVLASCSHAWDDLGGTVGGTGGSWDGGVVDVNAEAWPDSGFGGTGTAGAGGGVDAGDAAPDMAIEAPPPTWQTGSWGDCSAGCGSGTRSRSVWCEDWTGAQVSDKECSGDTKPKSSESCKGEWYWKIGSCSTDPTHCTGQYFLQMSCCNASSCQWTGQDCLDHGCGGSNKLSSCWSSSDCGGNANQTYP